MCLVVQCFCVSSLCIYVDLLLQGIDGDPGPKGHKGYPGKPGPDVRIELHGHYDLHQTYIYM